MNVSFVKMGMNVRNVKMNKNYFQIVKNVRKDGISIKKIKNAKNARFSA